MGALPFDVDPNEGRPLSGRTVPPGHLRIWRSGEDPARDAWGLHTLLGRTRPKMIRGYGGWTSTKREGRRAVTTDEGRDTPAYSVDLRLENRATARQPIAVKMRRLERLSGFDLADDEPPPVIQWAANVEHDFDHNAEAEWVIEDLQWGEDGASDRGTLLWQRATLIIGLYVEATAPGTGRSTSFARHELKVGWDLRDFARRYLGDAKRWKDVASLNRDNPRCPSTPSFKPSRAVMLLTPPREPRAKRAKRRGGR